MERERRDSLVVVDTDPFKLHYVWTLWRTGQVRQQEWDLFEPGRVRFGLPETGLTPDLLALGPREVRSGADLFERLLTRLD